MRSYYPSTNKTIVLALLTFCSLSTTCVSFLPLQQQQQKCQSSMTRRTCLEVSTSTPPPDTLPPPSSYNLPTVEFIDPQTGCEVVLLGCFHGTESSSEDVKQAITPDTDIVVLELCETRFEDLQSWVEEEKQEQLEGKNQQKENRPWIVAYLAMIQKTIQERGVGTGIAAAVLGGFSGMQTALSGFSPGLEFKTALECAQDTNAKIVLADREVGETLKQIGRIPRISFDLLFKQPNFPKEYQVHAATLQRAVFGPEGGNASYSPVQLGQALVRSADALKDLVRLTVPPTLLYACFLQLVLAISTTSGDGTLLEDSPLAAAVATVPTSSTIEEMVLHYSASFAILMFGYLGLALPSVQVILTERDACLAEGIQDACQRAGNNGRVVAVLGMLHLNGVADRMTTNLQK